MLSCRELLHAEMLAARMSWSCHFIYHDTSMKAPADYNSAQFTFDTGATAADARRRRRDIYMFDFMMINDAAYWRVAQPRWHDSTNERAIVIDFSALTPREKAQEETTARRILLIYLKSYYFERASAIVSISASYTAFARWRARDEAEAPRIHHYRAAHLRLVRMAPGSRPKAPYHSRDAPVTKCLRTVIALAANADVPGFFAKSAAREWVASFNRRSVTVNERHDYSEPLCGPREEQIFQSAPLMPLSMDGHQLVYRRAKRA